MVWDALVIFLLQILHCIIQEEINEDCVDAVRFLGLFFGLGLGLGGCLGVQVFGILVGLRAAFHARCLHLGVALLNLTFDQLHAPDTRATEFNFPV